MWAGIRDDMIWGNRTVELLGRRMKKYLDFNKVRLLFKSFFESQFKDCLLTWMFYSRKTNNRINKLHERAPRLVYSDY